MALWGKADSVFSTGTITVDYSTKTVTGSGTTFTNASAGDVLSIGVGNTFGEAVISGITSDLVLSIHSTQFLNGEDIDGAAYTISQKPKYTLHDTHYAADQVYGVDIYEAGVAKTTKYSVEHAGWVGIITYMDNHGNLRVKTETLVAMSSITDGTPAPSSPGDADDDAIFVDAVITILSGPDDVVGIGTDEDAVFVVETSVTPDYAPLSFQWFEDATPLSDDAEYSGTTTPILTVTNNGEKDDGREYSVVIESGDVSVTSGIATITYA
jgi:hypothetical protein